MEEGEGKEEKGKSRRRGWRSRVARRAKEGADRSQLSDSNRVRELSRFLKSPSTPHPTPSAHHVFFRHLWNQLWILLCIHLHHRK